MSETKRPRLPATRSPRGLVQCRAALEDHFAAHGTIPSMSGLASLWGYASKSSAARRVAQLIDAGVVIWSADRKLTPGPAFARLHQEATELAPFKKAGAAAQSTDPLGAALQAWSSDYDPALVRSYSVTARMLRIVKAMEQQMARSAAAEGLTSGDVLLLDALFRVGPPHRIAPTALKHYFLMTLAGVAKRVDRLAALGLIARLTNPDDARSRLIELTAKGHATLARLVEADRHAPSILWPSALPDDEYDALVAALTHAEGLIASE